MTVNRERLRVEATDQEASVTPLELFFDLVFVLALTQVTAYLADHLTPQGVVRGLLLVALLWWSWTGYAWLGNVVRADEGVVREVMLAAMATMFIFALAIPEAFDDLPGGLYGPVVVPICYLVFRLLHLTMFWIVSRNDPGLRRQIMRFAPSVLVATPDPAGRSGHDWPDADRAVGGRSRRRLRRDIAGWGVRLAAALGAALRRTAWADRHRGAGGVDRRDRGRHRRTAHLLADHRSERCSGSASQQACGGCTST